MGNCIYCVFNNKIHNTDVLSQLKVYKLISNPFAP